jgi:hypothetical protein
VHAVADFVTAIHTGGTVHPDFADGLEVIAVLEAGLESAATGRRITVPPIHTPEGGSS